MLTTLIRTIITKNRGLKAVNFFEKYYWNFNKPIDLCVCHVIHYIIADMYIMYI